MIEFLQSVWCFLFGHRWVYLLAKEDHGEPHLRYEAKYRTCDRCPELERGDAWHYPGSPELQPPYWQRRDYSSRWLPATDIDWDHITELVDEDDYPVALPPVPELVPPNPALQPLFHVAETEDNLVSAVLVYATTDGDGEVCAAYQGSVLDALALLEPLVEGLQEQRTALLTGIYREEDEA